MLEQKSLNKLTRKSDKSLKIKEFMCTILGYHNYAYKSLMKNTVETDELLKECLKNF